MNRRWEGYRQALMRAARACPISDAVPEGFERRVLRRLAPPVGVSGLLWGWINALARAAWASVGLTLLVAGAVWRLGPDGGGSAFEPDLETTLLAVLEDHEAWRW